MVNLFITFGILDAVDILLVAVLLYEIYSLVKGTSAINILFGMIILYVVWLVVKALNMQLLGSILSRFIDVGVIAIIIVFQQELRRFLLIIGKTEFFNRRNFTKNFLMLQMSEHKATDLHPILKACRNMSETKTGALIILAQDTDLTFYAQTGDIIDSNITEALIETIFFKNNPLHDGAMIIKDNLIHAARCVLPSTDKTDFPTNLGMRHRAAVGITEKSDALAIVVSEQTGAISLAHGGNINYNLSNEKLAQLLHEKLQ
jgi:diadenylate cyclase